MAATVLLGLTQPVTGTLAGTWGDTINNEITALLESAVAGTTTLSTDADVTLTSTVSIANQARQAILLFSGARTALRTITAPAQSKEYVVINATTGGFSVKLVGAGPTTGLTIVNGEKALVAWNGSDFVRVSTIGGPQTSGTIDGMVIGGTTPAAVSGTTGTFSSNVQMASANGGPLAGLRNSIINGDMAIWQRGTAAITSAANGTYSADRFTFRSSYTGGTTTITQSTGPSQNLRFSTRFTHATATATVVTGQYYAMRQIIEKSVARMFGDASNITVSFWYKSNRTGSHACVFDAGLTGAGFTGTTTAGSSTFTVNVADTWEYKTLTFPLVITGNGTNAENLSGALLTIGFADQALTTFSSISVGNYFDVTGVQLELGPVATPFEQRPIGMELALCQRYYEASPNQVMAWFINGTQAKVCGTYQTAKRGGVVPSVIALATINNAVQLNATMASGFNNNLGVGTITQYNYPSNSTIGYGFDITFAAAAPAAGLLYVANVDGLGRSIFAFSAEL